LDIDEKDRWDANSVPQYAADIFLYLISIESTYSIKKAYLVDHATVSILEGLKVVKKNHNMP
jgi:hypothetical protein